MKVNEAIENLPAEYVSDGLKMAKSMTMFGVPFSELSHDELLAACAWGWSSYRSAREDLQRQQVFRMIAT